MFCSNPIHTFHYKLLLDTMETVCQLKQNDFPQTSYWEIGNQLNVRRNYNLYYAMPLQLLSQMRHVPPSA